MCSLCGKSFTRLDHLKLHWKRHNGVKDHVCFDCGKTFTRSDAMKGHQRICTGGKPYKCSHCNMRFSQSGTLKIHERTHTGEKSYKCDQCGKCFTQKGIFNDHLKIHTERSHTHVIKSFAHIKTLKLHQRSHSGERLFNCEQCRKTFHRAQNLKRHLNVHTKQKPYIYFL